MNETNDTAPNTNAELLKMGEDVRKQGQGTTVKDLVFDPATGEFRTVNASQTDLVPSSGDIVTQMTEDGFAAEEPIANEEYRYNSRTGEFERRRRAGSRRRTASQAPANDGNAPSRGITAGDVLIVGGGIATVAITGWVGIPLMLYGLAKKAELL